MIIVVVLSFFFCFNNNTNISILWYLQTICRQKCNKLIKFFQNYVGNDIEWKLALTDLNKKRVQSEQLI